MTWLFPPLVKRKSVCCLVYIGQNYLWLMEYSQLRKCWIYLLWSEKSRDFQRRYSNLITLLLWSDKAMVVKDKNNEMLIHNFFFSVYRNACAQELRPTAAHRVRFLQYHWFSVDAGRKKFYPPRWKVVRFGDGHPSWLSHGHASKRYLR